VKTLTLRVLKRGIRIHCRDARTRALLAASYGMFEETPGVVDLDYIIGRDAVTAGFDLFRSGLGTVRAADDGALLARFDKDISVELQRLRADLYFLHAAVLAAGDSAIILVAPSGGGKSTLCWALVRRGLHYMSDEFAPIELDSLRVEPYPRALSLKTTPPGCDRLPDGAVSTARCLLVPPTLLDGTGRKPMPIGTVVFIRYRRDAYRPTVVAVRPAEAAARIYANALNPLAHAADGLDGAVRIAEMTKTFEVCATADLDLTSRLLLSVLDHQP
jgi:hypothetical protein